MFVERNRFGDINSIIHQFEAHAAPNPEDHEAKVACPAITPDRQRGHHPARVPLQGGSIPAR